MRCALAISWAKVAEKFGLRDDCTS